MIVGRAVDMNLTSTNSHRVPEVGCLVTEEMKEIGTSVGFGNVVRISPRNPLLKINTKKAKK